LEELNKLFTPKPDFKAIADVKIEFVDIGEEKAIDETRLEVSTHSKGMVQPSYAILNVGAAREGAAGKIPWINEVTLVAEFNKIQKEYDTLVKSTLALDSKLRTTYESTEDKTKGNVPENLKTYIPFVTANPLKILREKVIKLNLEINELQKNIVSEAGKNLEKEAATKLIDGYKLKIEEYKSEVAKFTPMANAYIEPIEQFYENKLLAEIKAADVREQAKLDAMTPEARAKYIAEGVKRFNNKTGGTRKKRHHSYPLKHSFKNRRV
jgi:hypothetical protein